MLKTHLLLIGKCVSSITR